jgi:hypothetical protein
MFNVCTKSHPLKLVFRRVACCLFEVRKFCDAFLAVALEQNLLFPFLISWTHTFTQPTSEGVSSTLNLAVNSSAPSNSNAPKAKVRVKAHTQRHVTFKARDIDIDIDIDTP